MDDTGRRVNKHTRNFGGGGESGEDGRSGHGLIQRHGEHGADHDGGDGASAGDGDGERGDGGNYAGGAFACLWGECWQ